MKIASERGEPAAAAQTEVEMQIRGLMIDPLTNMPIVVLKDVASDAVLPIWVGIFEANAIALELEKTATPRPMTHDLLRNMARGLNAVVRKVVVSELRDDTFLAVIWMEQDGETVAIDARPSDAHCAGAALGLPGLRQPRGAGQRQAGGGRAAECERGRDAALAGEPERRRHGAVQDVGTACMLAVLRTVLTLRVKP